MNSNRGVNLWRQISEAIAHDIRDLPSSERLAPGEELAQRYGVHQHTVRRALAHLQDRGLVRITQGRGTFVAERPVRFRLGLQTWFEQNVAESQYVPTRTILGVQKMPCNREQASALRLSPGSQILLVRLRGEANDTPIYVGQHYFPLSRLPGVEEEFDARMRDGTREVVFAHILKKLGISRFRRRDIRISSRLPEPDEARHLEIPESIPLTETKITIVDHNDQPIIYGFAAYCSNRVELTIDL